MIGANYNTPDFKPFQSGCSKCYPSTDFVKQNGGNKSLISTKAGKNFFKTPDFNVPMKTLVKNNSGKSYNTSAGGSKKKSNSNYMKGGNDDSKDIADFLKNVMDNKTIISEEMNGGAKKKKALKKSLKKKTKVPKKKTKVAKKGGMAPLDNINDGMPQNATFPNTGNFGVPQGVGTQMAVNRAASNPLLKAMKAPPLSEEMQNTLIQMEMAGGAKKKKDSKKKDSKKKDSKKKVVKKKKGGMSPLDGNNDGMPSNATFPNTGNFGVPQGVGTQMAVNSDTSNPLLKEMKASPLSQKIQDKLIQMEMAGGAKKKKKPTSSLKKIDPKKKPTSSLKKKKPKKKSSKKMKGGEESWGATGMPPQFYNPKAPLASFPSNSGKGAKSAYGSIQPNDIGTGMLAPFTTSNSKTANHATNMKTGGSRKKNGGGLIPSMSTSGPKAISSIADKTYGAVETFFKKLDKNYKNSVNKTKNIKIGNQRLIQGGAKKKKDAKKKKGAKKKKKKGEKGNNW